MQFVEQIFYFIVTLGVLVFVHEFGHFIAAKLCGMRAEVFAFGLGHRLFGYNKVNGFTFWELDKSIELGDHTDYRIAAFPIGGYVKIPGMIDESFDTDHIGRPPEHWEFRARPIWQRMIVITAGVIMNLLLAAAIFWGINYAQGKSVRETTDIGYVIDGSEAARRGLLMGDRVIQINGTSVSHWDQIMNLVYLKNMGSDITFTILREGHELQLFFPRTSIPEPTDRSLEATFGIIPSQTEITIGTVEPGRPADKLGLKPHDVILSLNGTAVGYDQQVKEIVQSSIGKPLLIEWKHGEQVMSGTALPTDDGRIGISFGLVYTGTVKRIQYSLPESFTEGMNDFVNSVRLSVQMIWQIIVGKRSFAESVSGPVKIAQLANQTAQLGMVPFLAFIALLSISLAIINIFPFPVLDGGHLIFLVYEGVFRREIPVRVKMGFQKVGFVLLLALMAFVVYNDIINY